LGRIEDREGKGEGGTTGSEEEDDNMSVLAEFLLFSLFSTV
jgi:hypothetical protein